MFKIGDYAVYRGLTVCKIEGIHQIDLGLNGVKRYYKVMPVNEKEQGTDIFVPLDSNGLLRNLLTKEHIICALEKIKDIKVSAVQVKKPAQIAAHYQELLDSNDLINFLKIIKEILQKEKSGAKKINETETRFKNKTIELVCFELSIVLNKSVEWVQNTVISQL